MRGVSLLSNATHLWSACCMSSSTSPCPQECV
nr:MAG TPA: hypothetical protein [Caudoviricetes sp.]